MPTPIIAGRPVSAEATQAKPSVHVTGRPAHVSELRGLLLPATWSVQATS